jgi:four helix bundle protein
MDGTRTNARFDLEERTAAFGEAVLRFAKGIPRNPVNDPLIGQLVRSATSVGANYCEADDGVSKKDFRNKIGLCRKESRESRHWLRMVASADEASRDKARELWKEASELNLIFSKIFRSASE